MFKVYLYHKSIHKATEEHSSHLLALRSAQNWALLRRDNTYKIENYESMKEMDYSLHMDKLLDGFI